MISEELYLPVIFANAKRSAEQENCPMQVMLDFANISNRSWNAWNQGINVPGVFSVYRLAVSCGMSFDEIIGVEPFPDNLKFCDKLLGAPQLKKLFAYRFQLIRSSAGYTYEDLAESCGIEPNAAYMYLTAKALPTLQKMFILCELFNVNPGYLLGLADKKKFYGNLLWRKAYGSIKH